MKLYLDTLYFDYVIIGIQKYEIFIYDKKNQSIKLLDNIEIIDKGSNRKFNGIVTELSYHKYITNAIEEVGFEKVLPNAISLIEAVKLYGDLSYGKKKYRDVEEEYGVLRIKFQIITS